MADRGRRIALALALALAALFAAPPTDAGEVSARAAFRVEPPIGPGVDTAQRRLFEAYRRFFLARTVDSSRESAFDDREAWMVYFEELPQRWLPGLGLYRVSHGWEGGHAEAPVCWVATKGDDLLFYDELHSGRYPDDSGRSRVTVELPLCPLTVWQAWRAEWDAGRPVQAQSVIRDGPCARLGGALAEAARRGSDGDAQGIAHLLLALEHGASRVERVRRSTALPADLIWNGSRQRLPAHRVRRKGGALTAEGAVLLHGRGTRLVRYTLHIDAEGLRLEHRWLASRFLTVE